ncbi:hypothetical protein R1flu_019896 [Riccia fluitans]|uniref:Uncharacterized protein n=1 Tax=Riccia fluitans TaxID=41844 RepID=A0ABD1ZK75_9MARC
MNILFQSLFSEWRALVSCSVTFRDEYKLRHTIREETEQKLRESSHEIIELRTLLNVLEKSSTAAEAQYLEALKETKKECDTLRKDLATALAAQKEYADRLVNMERLRNHLEDALAQNRESVSQIADYRNARDEANRKMELIRLELAEALAVRGREQAEQTAQLQKLQRKWAEEKSDLLKREDKLVKASKKEFCSKYRALKKRLQHTSKRLVSMTVDHNQLTVRLKECEAQLAIAQMTRFHTAVVGSAPSISRSSVRVETLNRGLFEADMKELADRQAKFLAQTGERLS